MQETARFACMALSKLHAGGGAGDLHAGEWTICMQETGRAACRMAQLVALSSPRIYIHTAVAKPQAGHAPSALLHGVLKLVRVCVFARIWKGGWEV